MEFKAGDIVQVLSSGQIGAVLCCLYGFETVSYEVLVNGEKLILECTQIKRVDDIYDYYESREEFDSVLTSLTIKNPGNDLFSLNAAKIDFIPYQYRPVLKIIKADEPRILIADDVGIGKTIEAGLIVKELSARQSMNNVMIFCPKPLVAESKWKNEMRSKFNEKFQHMDRKTLMNAIKECDYEGEWADEYGRCIIPYSILDEDLLTGKETIGRREIGLLDLNPAPHFDLVIVDEAHHIRNQNTQAYKVIEYFCMHAEAVVFLSATPIQMGDHDLYVLLNLLRPDYVLDEETFKIMAEPNPYLNTAIEILRFSEENWREDAYNTLDCAKETEWAQRTALSRELEELQNTILQSTRNDSKNRVALISKIEKLHTFSNIINRTRKRDIGNFTTRKPVTIRNKFTEKQQTLYDSLICTQTEILLLTHKEFMIKFLMSTLYRQAASCIFGLAPCIEDILTRHVETDDPSEIDSDDYEKIVIPEGIREKIKNVLMLSSDIDNSDQKYDSLKKIIISKQDYDNNKIMIFSSFRHTLAYLFERLNKDGYRVGLVTGGVIDSERLMLRERFQLDRNNPEAIDIMLFSEVGCEGLDYQFCNCLVNYDLPWNPMRIEQRIGRIDRNGQKNDSILIYNLITDGTIDADIYDRCLMRIGVFNQSLGCGEEILGEISKEICDIAVDYSLSPKQKEEKLRQLSDNKIRLINENQVMEDNQYDFLSLRMPCEEDRKNVQDFTNFWLMPEKIENLLSIYVKNRYAKSILEHSDKSFEIKFSSDEKADLLSEYYAIKADVPCVDKSWIAFLKGGDTSFRYAYSGDVAKANNICVMNALHPLALLASREMHEKRQVVMGYQSQALAGRNIGFAIYEWRYVGERNRSQIKIITDQEDVLGDIEDIVKHGTVIARDLPGKQNAFSELHSKLWTAERRRYKAKQLDICNKRKESLALSYQRRLETIQRQEKSTDSINIKRMKHKEYENVSADLKSRLAALERQKERTDVISKLVCSGIVIVEA